MEEVHERSPTESDGWARHQDLVTGSWYWFHAATGESQWEEHPEKAETDGWARHHDRGSGAWYWFHAATGASQWE